MKREETGVGIKMIECGNFCIISCCQGDSIRYPQHDLWRTYDNYSLTCVKRPH